MKKIFFLIIVLSLVHSRSFALLLDSLFIKRVKEIAIQVQKKYAPDKRTEYFHMQLQTEEPLTYSLEVTKPEALAELMTLLKKENIAVTINGQTLPSKALQDKIYGVANLSVINSRYAPSHTAEMATQSLLGTPVKILKRENGNYFIRTPDNYLSWTETAGLTAMNKTEFEAWQKSEKVIFSNVYGHAYSEASETSPPVSDLVAGNILKLLGRTGSFYKVSFPDNRVAFISADKAQSFASWQSQPDPSADQIVKTAKTFLGVPYLWGGTSPKGMDCSGFTKMSYFLNGIVLPRDASQQAFVGENIDIYDGDSVSVAESLKNLMPGDLMFFAGDKENLRITHTAIYLGNGEFIQAAGLVRINSMISNSENYDDYQSRTLVSARRILTAIGKAEVTRVDQHPYYTQME